MKVKIVSITKPIEYDITAEQLIVHIARVSNKKNELNFDTTNRLIKYMIDNGHWSPFEMADMTIEVETSRAIAQQILRHRSFSFQEFSLRYSETNELEEIELRKEHPTNRQSSTDFFDNRFDSRIDKLLQESLNLYNDMISSGVARETARFILPLTIQTRMYMKGNIRSWIHYLKVRLDDHTQKEHRLIAEKVLDIFRIYFPIISKTLF